MFNQTLGGVFECMRVLEALLLVAGQSNGLGPSLQEVGGPRQRVLTLRTGGLIGCGEEPVLKCHVLFVTRRWPVHQAEGRQFLSVACQLLLCRFLPPAKPSHTGPCLHSHSGVGFSRGHNDSMVRSLHSDFSQEPEKKGEGKGERMK